MKKKLKFTAYKSRKLTRKKARQLGLVESFRMVRIGRKDGRIGLPKPDEQNKWSSPQLRKESDAYREFHAAAWARAEIELANIHVEAENLFREIRRSEKQLEALLVAAPSEITTEQLNRRYSGEETLDVDVINARRRKEYAKENAQFAAKKQGLETYLEQAYVRMLKLNAQIMQVEGATRLTCEKVRNHSMLRIDAYWQGTHKTHAKADSLPPEPLFICPDSKSEELYLSAHEVRDEEVRQMRKRLAEIQGQVDSIPVEPISVKEAV